MSSSTFSSNTAIFCLATLSSLRATLEGIPATHSGLRQNTDLGALLGISPKRPARTEFLLMKKNVTGSPPHRHEHPTLRLHATNPRHQWLIAGGHRSRYGDVELIESRAAQSGERYPCLLAADQNRY